MDTSCVDGCAILKEARLEQARTELELWNGINRIANYTQAVGLDVAVIRSRFSQFVAVQCLFMLLQVSMLLLAACK